MISFFFDKLTSRPTVFPTILLMKHPGQFNNLAIVNSASVDTDT